MQEVMIRLQEENNGRKQRKIMMDTLHESPKRVDRVDSLIRHTEKDDRCKMRKGEDFEEGI